MEYQNITNIKFSGIHKDVRKIKCQIGKHKIQINVQWGHMNIYGISNEEISDNIHKELRHLFITNYLWIHGWDINEYTDFSQDSLNKDFDMYVKLDKITVEESEYLKQNVISDYYDNKSKYPKFVDIVNKS